MQFYTKRGNRGTVSFKMTHIEAKSINIWLRYDPKWEILIYHELSERDFSNWLVIKDDMIDIPPKHS